MIKTTIKTLQKVLQDAADKGCSNVKLQLYESWQEVTSEQHQPSQPLESYQIDSRFYNTIEFETQIKNMETTNELVTLMEGNTLVIRVSLSDHESLFHNLGINDACDH